MATMWTSAMAASAFAMRPISGHTERVRKLSYTRKNQVAPTQSSSVRARNGQ